MFKRFARVRCQRWCPSLCSRSRMSLATHSAYACTLLSVSSRLKSSISRHRCRVKWDTSERANYFLHSNDACNLADDFCSRNGSFSLFEGYVCYACTSLKATRGEGFTQRYDIDTARVCKGISSSDIYNGKKAFDAMHRPSLRNICERQDVHRGSRADSGRQSRVVMSLLGSRG